MDHFATAARSLFDSSKHDHSHSNHTCPVLDTSGPAIVPLIGNLTYHKFATILSGSCAIFSAIVVGTLAASHAFSYSNPVQQRQIIRIVLLIPWVSLFSFLIVWRDDIGEYLDPSLDFGCSFALSSFLLYMCDLVLSHRTGFEALFGQGAQSDGVVDQKSPAWLKWIWYGVLQFIPISIILWVATAATLAAGVYCRQSNSVHFAHIWLTVLDAYVTTVAIFMSLRFYGKNKATLSKHKILLKLFTFKGVIGLNFLQSFVISILSGHNILKPTQYMSYHDINTGLASLILSCEMPIFAILLLFAFPPMPYTGNAGPVAGPMTAIVEAFDIRDLLSAFFRGPMRLVRDQQRQILRQNSMRIDMGHLSDEEMELDGRPKAPKVSNAF